MTTCGDIFDLIDWSDSGFSTEASAADFAVRVEWTVAATDRSHPAIDFNDLEVFVDLTEVLAKEPSSISADFAEQVE